MFSAGIARRVDMLGRVVIPKELRDKYGMKSGTPVEMNVDGDSIVLSVYKPECFFCKSKDNVIEYKNTHICSDCINTLKNL